MNTAFIFPGQGAQKVGMGKGLYDNFSYIKNLFEELNDSVGKNLTKIMFEGPHEDLTLTSNAQPALMAVSIAILKILEKEYGIFVKDSANLVAGHSLGEYTALCAAGSLTFKDTAEILKARGEAMSSQSSNVGAMAACIGVDLEIIEQIINDLSKIGKIDIANDNSDSQVVISGENKLVDIAIEKFKDMGKKAIKLKVNGAFHSSLMDKAQEIMAIKLSHLKILNPVPPIICNVTANMVKDSLVIRELLLRQITERVRWRETMNFMKNFGINKLVEIGSSVLTGISKKSGYDFENFSVTEIEDIEYFSKNF